MKLQWLSHFLPCCFLLPVLMPVGAEQHMFDVTIWPENPVVEHGGSLWLNCSTSCQEADARGGLETSLMKEKKDNGSHWAVFQLVNITEWASATECSFSCYGEHKSVQANIMVYQIPEHVMLDPVPIMEMGKVYNLTCRVANAAPIQLLTVTVYKGTEKLHIETFENHSAPEASDILVTFPITAQQDNHMEEVTCHIALDLRPRGQLLEKTSSSEVLKVFDFLADPQLHTLRYVQASSNLSVTCEIAGVFPAEEAQFDLKFAEQSLNASITLSGNTVRAQAQVSSLATGNYQLNCTVSLGPITKSAVETVHIYNFPQPSLEIYPSEALANNLVTVLCNSSAPEPPSFSLQIQNASGRILASSDDFPLQLNLTAQEEDNGQEFVCVVELEIDGITITKHTSATLSVFYVPEMDELSCPSNHTWVERTQQMLHCLAKGNPKPLVACFKEGIAYDVEEKTQVDRSHAGIYNCTATNELGSSTRTITIHVEYGPELEESKCPSHQTWLEGNLWNLSCQADGIPIPEVFCIKDGKVYNAGRMHNITQSHAGIYYCNATNVHGSITKIVAVTVEYEPEMDDSSCPHNWILTVGTPHVFTCFAWGNPEPTIECTKDGMAYSPGILQNVTREYAGSYLCTATNIHGSISRAVSIQVEYKPEMDESNCPSNWTLVEEALPTFLCNADGFPPPEIICTKDNRSYDLSQGQRILANNGTFWCNATNRHGSVAKAVKITVETKPKMDESSCPSNQTWLEGTLQSLACEANGIPTPLVLCAKEGTTGEFYREQNVSRNDSGIYECNATNGHGTERWMVNVQVEYRPATAILSVSGSLPIRRGENITITCQADGSPAASYTWRLPHASNIIFIGNNSTVLIVHADGQNNGVYECTASNKHGQQHSQVEIQVEDHWLYIIVIVAIAGATMLVLGGMAGVIYYLKSTACKKGEYNVRDAENSTEATFLNRERPCDIDIYGIQLTRT
ncbi:intercellular adhesion molecule 5 isoform X1 [Pantherophis guttatus]|uniref:Intercellular adhesion molecule 5 isoform X1 n=1 Tax=Pantherophis guttatus TaxID=94885 RepID=A0A6P9DFV5_PANGU|nr:intercellular adhesion molecule 5 isoform X1 [Pantherophis guttatus]XP_060539438.1 intercellular adhesion molecule 5 isoform X1 [Pantherophis guttatus]